MTDLICIRDAYRAMNKLLHGEEIAFGFHEGCIGALGRVCRIIGRNVSEKWKKDDDGAMEILDDISLTPEKRAEILLEE
ncbi:MAG: hypothetical protein NC489_24515 [Ruminococcus flavefaciens]|nr:hypothetical protein [Ruminococcus flavefaciens]